MIEGKNLWCGEDIDAIKFALCHRRAGDPGKGGSEEERGDHQKDVHASRHPPQPDVVDDDEQDGERPQPVYVSPVRHGAISGEGSARRTTLLGRRRGS